MYLRLFSCDNGYQIGPDQGEQNSHRKSPSLENSENIVESNKVETYRVVRRAARTKEATVALLVVVKLSRMSETCVDGCSCRTVSTSVGIPTINRAHPRGGKIRSSFQKN